MIAPSGREFSFQEVQTVVKMYAVGFIRHDPNGFTLRSGIHSIVYVMGREDTTDNPDFEWEIGDVCREAVQKYVAETGEARQPCLIGIPTAGTAFAQAAAMVSYAKDPPEKWICHRIMREWPKEHGPNQKTWVNGAPDFGKHCYLAIDNVITDSRTKKDYAGLLDASGYRSKEMPWVIVVDRQQGGIANLEREGFRTIVLYNLLDLAFILGETGHWPQSVVAEVQREIREHQLIV